MKFKLFTISQFSTTKFLFKNKKESLCMTKYDKQTKHECSSECSLIRETKVCKFVDYFVLSAVESKKRYKEIHFHKKKCLQ